jgi:hypothetical protein
VLPILRAPNEILPDLVSVAAIFLLAIHVGNRVFGYSGVRVFGKPYLWVWKS